MENIAITYVARRLSVRKRNRNERIKNAIFFVLAVPLIVALGYITMWTGYFVTLEIL